MIKLVFVLFLVDWMRIGAFYFQSSTALLSEHLEIPKRIPKCDENLENTIEHSGICLLTNVKIGIWLAGNEIINVLLSDFV